MRTEAVARVNSSSDEELGYHMRKHFPYFSRKEERGSAYLDSAASALKLDVCVERMSSYLAYEHANVHRGAYELSMAASENYALGREAVRSFCRVPASHEVIFTSGATESLNVVARGFEESFRKNQKPILTTTLEHHSNFIPWQQLARKTGSPFLVVGINSEAEVQLSDFYAHLKHDRPRIAAFTAMSNAFGTITPVKELVEACREVGCISVVDATQSVVHGKLSVEELGADFIVFSAHKLYGPTGLGVLIGRKNLLEELKPSTFGGGMIGEVTVEHTTWADIPARFEAGTPAIAEVISFTDTLEKLARLHDEHDVAEAERALFEFAVEKLARCNGVTLVGPLERDQESIISFLVDGVHPHDMATIADSHGVQVRAGHHCVMPAMRALQLPATTRLSFGLYSVKSDIDRLVEAIGQAKSLFG